MVFSSPEFLFLFLPLIVLGYYLLLRFQQTRAITAFLFAASLLYYAYWRPENTWLILASIGVNYGLGQLIAQADRFRRTLFAAGIALNLSALGYYKYTDFAISSLNTLLHTDFPLRGIVLPIGISFFTFQQIAYLSDIYTKKHDPAHEGFLNYCCFVCFFPQLIAGPIVHHQEMMPQFFNSGNHSVHWENIYHGLLILSIGLAKKVLIADNLSPIVHYCFDETGSLTFLEAALGSISYTLQLYFDFSGYSDMAIGCALFFNIHLPWNFNSPYKATDIQDFWRRWHITLSRWLRDYLYIPLGGNRRGTGRTLGNLFVTFLLGGLWHGAAWTFVLWGALHGLALAGHRIWSQMFRKKMPAVPAWLLTFAFINAAWIVFRAPSFERVRKFIDAFLGYNDFLFRVNFRTQIIKVTIWSSFTQVCLFVLACLLLTASCNTQKIIRMKHSAILYIFSLLFALCCIVVSMPDVGSEFIYSQF